MASPPAGLLGRERAESPLRHVTSTTHERRSLDDVINLSDAHCRQTPTQSQLGIVARLPELFAEAHARPQLELEREFIAAFMAFAGEEPPLDTRRHLLSYSSSCAITMVASYCSRHRLRIALLEPVFDNIPSILRREGVDVVAIGEEDFGADRLAGVTATLEPDVIWVVAPNNPTGWTLTEEQFRDLVQRCATHGWTLVLDMSFRFFAPDLAAWSQYDILESSGISYLVIEDTGKTWSTNEVKVGLTVCASGLYEEMYRLHDDLLQGVSPLALRLLTEFIADSAEHGRDASILDRMRDNRAILRSVLADSPLRFHTGLDSPVSVDWIQLADGLDGQTLARAVAAEGVHVLPGANFFWSDPARGRSYVRIPLARDADLLRRGAPVIRDAARRLADGQAR